MLQITPSFWEKIPLPTPKCPKLLDDEEQCSKKKKKAVMTTSNLASAQGEAVSSSS